MSNKNKKTNDVNENVVATTEPEAVATEKVEAKKDKPKKEKKVREHKLGRKVKETTSELKKVSWLSFGQVCKRTVIVIGFVLLCTAVLFGIDQLLSWIYKLLIGA
ncbi:MAG: preprotein translocase subunit SecE [Clostridiales bacterium]|nr:preprotein translocase subunit SecE [Candidatus Apopatousia equi]